MTTKIIQPEFKPKDIIFLFFQFKEDNEYYIGPFFEDNIISSIKMTKINEEVLKKIKEHNLTSMKEISVICSQKIYEAIFREYNEELPNDINKLKELFINKKDELNNKNREDISSKKELLEALINTMELSIKFDEIIKIKNEESPQNIINFDDLKIFNKIDNNENVNVNIESLLLEKINPSFKFYIIKNMERLQSLINSKLTKSDISVLFNNEINYIPFWIFLIRNMSSINCIKYENKNNNKNIKFVEEISLEVRNKIQDLAIKGKVDELNNGWLNLILENLPEKVELPNIHIFYSFFINLFEEINASDYLKEIIQNIVKDYYLKLINYSFEGNMDFILSEDIKISNDDILKFIEMPKEYIKSKIYNDYSDKIKEIMNNKNFQDFENILEKI